MTPVTTDTRLPGQTVARAECPPTRWVSEVRWKLLAWFDKHQRDLPWRYAPGDEPDPYRVWLSEVMLQQTQVETVKPYYRKWLERFSSLEELAAADLDEVLKAWEGLGYYSRARNFHRAVREVVEVYAGRIPDDPRAFRSLAGVGRYTAGAVMSIAYGQAEPIVDGNVRRVFARLLDAADPVPDDLWLLASRLVLGERPGDLNQAMMELGATVCTPRSPHCNSCPVEDHCAARAAGTQADRPRRRVRPPIPTERHGVALLEVDGRYPLRRRNDRGRLGGMWEFPGVMAAPDESTESAALRSLREIARIEARSANLVGSVTHVFTHVKVIYDVYRVEPDRGSLPDIVAASGASQSGETAWSSLEGLSAYALPRAQRKIAGFLPSPVPS